MTGPEETYGPPPLIVHLSAARGTRKQCGVNLCNLFLEFLGSPIIRQILRMILAMALLAYCLSNPAGSLAQPSAGAFDADAIVDSLMAFPLPREDIFWQGEFEEETPDGPGVVRQAQILTYPGIITYRVYDSIRSAQNSVHATVGLRNPLDAYLAVFSPTVYTGDAIYDDLVEDHKQKMAGRDIMEFGSGGSYSACVPELNVIVCGFSSSSWATAPGGAAVMGAIVGLALLLEVTSPVGTSSQSQSLTARETSSPDQVSTPAQITPYPSSGSGGSGNADIRERVIAATVQIVVKAKATSGGYSVTRPAFSGSGTIVSPNGLILTNWHVVDMDGHRKQLRQAEIEAANQGLSLSLDLIDDLSILVSDGVNPPEEWFHANVVAGDPVLDLAVIQVVADRTGPIDRDALRLPFVPLGDSDAVRLGDQVDVYGYPGLSDGALTFTRGVVSAFPQDERVPGRAWIATDALLSHGSSGGAAVNQNGEVIGVPTAGTPLECLPGDTNGDGRIDSLDVGCVVSEGGSLGMLRPSNLAIELLRNAGWGPNPVDIGSRTTLPAPTPMPQPPAHTPTPTPSLNPTWTPTPRPTAFTATPTPVPIFTPTRTPEEPPLLPASLPLPHASCFRIEDEGARTFDELVARLGGTDEARYLLADWGWKASVYRVFACDTPPHGEAGWIEVDLHLFNSETAAQEAVDYFAQQRAAGTMLLFGSPPPVGDHGVALSGPTSNGKEFTIYASQGPLLIRVSGVSSTGIPFSNVVSVAQSVLTAQLRGEQPAPAPAPPASAAALPASAYLPASPAVNYADCFQVYAKGTYTYSDVVAALAREGLTKSQIDELGWTDGAYIDFTCANPPFGRASLLEVIIHQFPDAQLARRALPYFDRTYAPKVHETRSCDAANAVVICVMGRSLSGSPLSDVHFVLNQVVAAAR